MTHPPRPPLPALLHRASPTVLRAVACAVLLGACTTETPSPSVTEASVPAVPLAFTNAAPMFVSEVEELHEDADGRVWLARYQPPGLVRATFGESTVVDTLGALGSGPGEFRMPFAVMDAPDGGVVALDGVARRMVGFARDGTPSNVRTIPETLDQFLVRVDTLGNWVSALSDLLENDSMPLVRRAADDDESGLAERLGRIHLPKATVSIPMEGRTYVAPPEYAARDTWGVLADGTIWIARGGPHQVDYRLPDGSSTVGGPRAFAPIQSTEADRGSMRGLPAADGVPLDAMQYAPEKGPFIEARAASDGEVWTWRTQAAPKVQERYTVFRPGMAETYDVTLPLHHRVVGLGRESVYVAEQLDTGGWRITRHPRPIPN